MSKTIHSQQGHWQIIKNAHLRCHFGEMYSSSFVLLRLRWFIRLMISTVQPLIIIRLLLHIIRLWNEGLHQLWRWTYKEKGQESIRNKYNELLKSHLIAITINPTSWNINFKAPIILCICKMPDWLIKEDQSQRGKTTCHNDMQAKHITCINFKKTRWIQHPNEPWFLH